MRKRTSSFVFTVLAILLSFVCLNVAVTFADDSEQTTYTDPEKAGPDYEVQGEYLGKDTSDEQHRWGGQVIALGDGKFRLVGYQGGLPGDGWSRGDKKITIEGERKDGKTVFEKDDHRIEIENGVLTVYVGDEKKATLKQIQRKSPTLGAKPPENATVLFDGQSAEHFENGETTEEGFLKANCWSKKKFGDHTLHIEFRTPFKPFARGQARGNSGVYAQSRYEIQVLDSFGLEGRNNECGGIYSIAEPKVNMCFPPLTWQTYDIDFTAARYDDDGKKTKNARITIRHNGVVIHDDLELPHGTPGRHLEGPGPDALYLQGHGNPVVFRNIWVLEKK